MNNEFTPAETRNHIPELELRIHRVSDEIMAVRIEVHHITFSVFPRPL